MTIQTTDAARIELAMIQQDTQFFLELLPAMQSSKNAGIMAFGFIPYYSLFTHESFRYFMATMPDYARRIKPQHEDLIRSSRLKIKLFEGEDIIQALMWVADYHYRWYNAKHVGFWSW